MEVGLSLNKNLKTEKSASPCRLGRRFFRPLRDRVNDKKVNEENSIIIRRMNPRAERCKARRSLCILLPLLLDTR